jgi:hypothetical protein
LYLGNSKIKNDLYDLLTINGFVRVVEDVICLEKHPSVYGKPFEDWYVSKKHLDVYRNKINEWNLSIGKETV